MRTERRHRLHQYGKGERKMTKQEFLSNIACFLGDTQITEFQALKIPSAKSSLLLYNTDDLWLSKPQFETLTKFVSTNEKIYIAQLDSAEVYELTTPIKYDVYDSLNLFSTTFICSENFEWLIVIDEGLESGIGVLIGENDFVQQYIDLYGHALRDIYDLITFHYKDSLRNPYSIENLVQILSLGHPFAT